MQLICPQFYLPLYGWQSDQDKEFYIIIKAKNEFQGPQFTVLYQAELKDHFQGHIYRVSLFCGCSNVERKEEVTPFHKVETMASGNTDTQDSCYICLPDLTCQVSEVHHLCSSQWTALCQVCMTQTTSIYLILVYSSLLKEHTHKA